MSVIPDREALARYSMSVADVQDVIAASIGGCVAGQVFEGDRRFNIVVRMLEELRGNVEAIRRLPVRTKDYGKTL